MNGRIVSDGDTCIKLKKLGSVSGESCYNLSNYDRLRNKTKIFQTGGSLFHEQRMFASHELGVESKMTKSLMLGSLKVRRNIRFRLGNYYGCFVVLCGA